MRIYWTMDAIPELAGFSKEERRGIWQKHCWVIWRSWRAWGAVAIYLIVMSLVILFCAAGATLVPDYIDPGIAPIIGAIVGMPPAVMIGAFIFGVVLCEIIRNEIRKTLSSGINPDVAASWIGCGVRWSWIGCGGGGFAGGVLGAVVGCFAGFAEGGSWGALFGACMGIIVGGNAGCGVGGIRAGRKLPLGASASAQFSIGLFAGAFTTATITLFLALVFVLMTR